MCTQTLAQFIWIASNVFCPLFGLRNLFLCPLNYGEGHSALESKNRPCEKEKRNTDGYFEPFCIQEKLFEVNCFLFLMQAYVISSWTISLGNAQHPALILS